MFLSLFNALGRIGNDALKHANPFHNPHGRSIFVAYAVEIILNSNKKLYPVSRYFRSRFLDSNPQQPKIDGSTNNVSDSVVLASPVNNTTTNNT